MLEVFVTNLDYTCNYFRYVQIMPQHINDSPVLLSEREIFVALGRRAYYN